MESTYLIEELKNSLNVVLQKKKEIIKNIKNVNSTENYKLMKWILLVKWL